MKWHTEFRKVSELKNWEDNPRTISGEAYEELKESIGDLGNFEPLVIDTDGTVLAGNQRLKIHIENGDEEVEVSVPERKLTEEEIKKIGVISNRHSGEWDMDKLANDFEDILEELGANDLLLEIDDLLPEVGFEVKEDDYEEPEDLQTTVVLGDVYQLGEHRLMCGDSTKIEDVEKLMNGEKADMVFTDPPYNTKMQQGRASKGWGIIENDNMPESNFEEFCNGFVGNLYAFTKQEGDKYICMGWSAYHILYKAMPNVKNCIVWVKNNFGLGHGYRPQHEFIVYDGGTLESHSESNVWNESKDAPSKYKHPTQKPVALSTRAIQNSSKRNDKVIDLFGGSGSTLIACEQTNRKCYMMEIDPYYCQVIIDRWEKFTNKKAVKLN